MGEERRKGKKKKAPKSIPEHRVVLDLALGEGRAVVGDDHQLGLSGPHRVHGSLLPQGVLTRTHHQLEAGVDVLHGTLGLLGHHFEFC